MQKQGVETDQRPVHVRSSASARDFWCRIRDDDRLSPDFRVRESTTQSPAPLETPFNRQRPPTWGAAAAPQRQRLTSSRVVERKVLTLALRDAENIPPPPDNAIENRLLKKELHVTRAHLQRVLRINHALTGAMVCKEGQL